MGTLKVDNLQKRDGTDLSQMDHHQQLYFLTFIIKSD